MSRAFPLWTAIRSTPHPPPITPQNPPARTILPIPHRRFHTSTPTPTHRSQQLTQSAPRVPHLSPDPSSASSAAPKGKARTPPKNPNLPPRPKIDEDSITEKFLKGTGPGGQKINKTSSAVQLTHLPTGIVLKCQATRSRTQNRKIARRLMAERVEELELGEGARTVVKRGREAVRNRSGEKKRGRKYRALAAVGEGEVEEVEEGEGEGTEEEEWEEVGTGEGEVGMEVREEEPEPRDKVTAMFEEARQRIESNKKKKVG